jgi:hypothetical protein
MTTKVPDIAAMRARASLLQNADVGVYGAHVVEMARDVLALCAVVEEATKERETYRLALDAIARAHSPSQGCTPECLCVNVEDEDCDCGYVEAADDVGEYARAVLCGEWIPYDGR